MVRDIVLDPATGLPQVVATRSEDGVLTFRVARVHPGGMAVLEPVSDGLLRELRAEYRKRGDEKVALDSQLQEIARRYAQTLLSDDEQRQGKLDELEAQARAAGQLVEEYREKVEQLEAELEQERAGRGETVTEPTTPVRPRTPPARRRTAA